MNNCAAAAVLSWPATAWKVFTGGVLVIKIFHIHVFFFAFVFVFASEVICSHNFHFAYLFSAHGGTNVFQQLFLCRLWLIKAAELCFSDAQAVRRILSRFRCFSGLFRWSNQTLLCCGRTLPGEGTSCHAIWLSDTRGEEGLQQPLRGDRQVWPRTGRQVVSRSALKMPTLC